MWSYLKRRIPIIGAVLHAAAQRFLRIDGSHWAGSFAFNAFLSIFPLLIIFVTLASFFVDPDRAGYAVVSYMEGFAPLDGEMRGRVFGAMSGVVHARGRAGVIALVVLMWTAVQCFSTLVQATNRAWDNEAFSWWRLPLRGLALLGVTAGAVVVGMAAPALASVAESWLSPLSDFPPWISTVGGLVVPLLLLFLSLTLFYRLAPRRETRFSEVWMAAASATVLLQTIESLFVIYLQHFATLNAVYGVFGGVVALLLWIYLSACGFIFGACLCAAQSRPDRDELTP